MCLIALVDDRETILASHVLILELHGITNTRSYTDPRDLLSDMRKGLRPDLVVTDYYMPEMNGAELLQAISGLFGEIPAIIVTGYPEGLQEMGPSVAHLPVICKGQPDFYKDLFRIIESVLGHSPQPKSLSKTEKTS